MLPDNLDTVQIEVTPGLALPAAAADFIFNRLEWISEGETGLFETSAPEGFDFNDLCQLAFLLSKQEFLLAQDMVENHLRLPSVMLPSATMVEGNDNYLKKKPFRGRLKPCGKQSRKRVEKKCSVGEVGAGVKDTEVPALKIIGILSKRFLEEGFPYCSACKTPCNCGHSS